MFTGIIEAVGTIREWAPRRAGAAAGIGAARLAAGLRPGDSIAVDGACLTVTGLRGDTFTCDLSPETLSRTTLGRLRVGSQVNLERPLRLGDRLGGHIVTGHVDGIGEILQRTVQGDAELVRIRFPQALASLLVMKGSIAVDGISLTVAELADDRFGVAVIPYTLQQSTLGSRRIGDPVNLEADILGKHVARLLAAQMPTHGGGLTLGLLQEHGFA
jgi:riboflavin synthase